jgi:hypothetical protein
MFQFCDRAAETMDYAVEHDSRLQRPRRHRLKVPRAALTVASAGGVNESLKPVFRGAVLPPACSCPRFLHASSKNPSTNCVAAARCSAAPVVACLFASVPAMHPSDTRNVVVQDAPCGRRQLEPPAASITVIVADRRGGGGETRCGRNGGDAHAQHAVQGLATGSGRSAPLGVG